MDDHSTDLTQPTDLAQPAEQTGATGQSLSREISSELSDVIAHSHVLLRKLRGNGGTTEGALQILELIWDEPLSPGELALILGVRKSSISSRITLLTEQGWIESIPSPKDRRSRLLRVTDLGRKIYEEEWEKKLDQIEAYIATFPLEEQRELKKALMTITELLLERPIAAS